MSTDFGAPANQVDAPVRSIVLPTAADALLLPSAMLAEVLTWGEIRERPGAPPWMIGSVAWRARELPVVWLRRDASRAAQTTGTDDRKLAVVYAVAADDALRGYAVVCSAVPRPVLASEVSVRATSPGAGLDEQRLFVKLPVRVDGEAAYIPDVDALEAAMLEGSGGWLSFAADETGA